MKVRNHGEIKLGVTGILNHGSKRRKRKSGKQKRKKIDDKVLTLFVIV